MNSLDDLELELRKLPGVKAAGFDEREDMLLVQLHLGDQVDSPEHPGADRRVAHRRPPHRGAHRGRDRALALDPRGGRRRAAPGRRRPTSTSPRPRPKSRAVPSRTAADESRRPTAISDGRRARLLAVLAFPDTDELEVHLILDGRRTIGRAVSSNGLVGAVEATLAAVRELGATFEPTPLWARELESDAGRARGRGGRRSTASSPTRRPTTASRRARARSTPRPARRSTR